MSHTSHDTKEYFAFLREKQNTVNQDVFLPEEVLINSNSTRGKVNDITNPPRIFFFFFGGGEGCQAT